MSVHEKVVIVTGGGRDIGAACVKELASRGAKVVFTYHASADRAEKLTAQIKADGNKATAMRADLTKQADVTALIESTVKTFGRIDSLVHVAGGLIGRKTITEMSHAHWQEVMDVNLTSLYMVCHAAIPHMPAGSAIVTFASQAGRDGGGRGAVAYATAKGAVMTFTRGLAKELGPDIRVNGVCPGMISTDFHNKFTPDGVRGDVASATPLKREGTAEEVAKLVAFLLSDEASFITGANVDINGGLVFS